MNLNYATIATRNESTYRTQRQSKDKQSKLRAGSCRHYYKICIAHRFKQAQVKGGGVGNMVTRGEKRDEF